MSQNRKNSKEMREEQGGKKENNEKRKLRIQKERVGIKENTTFWDNSLDIGKLFSNNVDLDVNISVKGFHYVLSRWGPIVKVCTNRERGR